MQLKFGGKFLTQFGDEISEFLPAPATGGAEHAAAYAPSATSPSSLKHSVFREAVKPQNGQVSHFQTSKNFPGFCVKVLKLSVWSMDPPEFRTNPSNCLYFCFMASFR